jgi:hypothetical protein
MPDPVQHIVVTDLRIPFIRLVMFFVKAALAAIPAAIIVGLLLMVLSVLVAAIFGTPHFVMRRWMMQPL